MLGCAGLETGASTLQSCLGGSSIRCDNGDTSENLPCPDYHSIHVIFIPWTSLSKERKACVQPEQKVHTDGAWEERVNRVAESRKTHDSQCALEGWPC